MKSTPRPASAEPRLSRRESLLATVRAIAALPVPGTVRVIVHENRDPELARSQDAWLAAMVERAERIRARTAITDPASEGEWQPQAPGRG